MQAVNKDIPVTLLLFLAAIPTAFFQSCGEDPPLRLTSREKVRIDTVYTAEVELLRPHWDSLCEAQFDSMVAVAVDSIIEVRRAEEIRLRNRLKQQQGGTD